MKPFGKLPAETFGTTKTGYMLVGEAPQKGARAFEDKAGYALRDALWDVGDETYKELEDLFFLAHAVRCVPPNQKDKTKTRVPTKTECGNCRPYLEFEMRALHPKLIIAIGTRAATAVLGAPVKIEEIHAQRHRIREGEVLTIVSPSPHNRASHKRLGLGPDNYKRWLTGLFGALIDDLS